MRRQLGIFLLLCLTLAGRAAEKVPGVTPENYGGLSGSLAMRGGDARAVVMPSVGGRVLSYSLNGENILFDNFDDEGRALLGASKFWTGGYQLDLGPELRGLPDHLTLWQGPWRWRVPGPFTVETISEPELSVGVQIEKEFVIDPDTGDLGLLQRMHNVISNDVSFCLWDRTLCKGNGFALLPLHGKSRFKAGWSIREGQSPRDYRYAGDKPADVRVRRMDDVLVVRAKELPDSPALKIGTDSDAGWIAYARGRLMLVKFFPVFRESRYSDGGNTLEFYCDSRVAELEPLSPEVTVKPGASYTFPEKWTLIELPREVKTYEQARALVKLIPKSPFAK